jgi:GH15 family glucan-1,4-alpha-glucosidase
MSSPIEDYAVIGDCETAALVARNGSIDWLCFPRFDSSACFAALLGSPENGRWLLAPQAEIRNIRRRYLDETLILETTFTTDDGEVALIDFMPHRAAAPDVMRIVVGRRGQVPMRMALSIRFDYGSIVPWVRRIKDGIRAIAGPDKIYCRAPVRMRGENRHTVSEFTVAAGQRIPFRLTWCPTHEPEPHDRTCEDCLQMTQEWWQKWSSQCTYKGQWRDAVLRSLITLKALTYRHTGGIVAAATTSLPEAIGSVRNWDYRYCWLRDSTFTLYALITGGFTAEAHAWRRWLVDAVAGDPSQLQIMYGLAGERRLTELELDWLPGYENSKPVRIGNAAHRQFQLDVYGEVMDSLQLGRRSGLQADENAWRIQKAIMVFLEKHWHEPDEGIWEVRGPRRHFVHSKVMAWVAVDRAIKAVEQFQVEGNVDRWRSLRDQIHKEVCEQGFDHSLNSFVQYYGSRDADASILMLPQVGFLPPTDPRIQGTVAYIQKQLLHDGFVDRYPTRESVDGLPPGEGAFLMCTFWLADCLALQERYDEAKEIFERLLSLRNDVGLLSEEYAPKAKRLLGNFPQAFSHVGLINTARNLSKAGGPAEDRQNQ